MSRWDSSMPNISKKAAMPPYGIEQFEPFVSTDWHSPNERRLDGDRVTEMVPAREWLAGRSRYQQNLAGVNPLTKDPRNHAPPALPRPQQRDHLHDRNREYALFDTANPGLATYVRVTRRRCGDETERSVANARTMQRKKEIAREMIEAADANELLELRHKGIQAAMGRLEEATRNAIACRHLPESMRPPVAEVPPENPRVLELQSKLKVMEDRTPVYPFFIDTIKASNLHKPKPSSKQTAPAKAPAAGSQKPAFVTRSGWPAEQAYFSAAGLKRFSQTSAGKRAAAQKEIEVRI